jgi:hypothetical protein
MPVNGRSGDEVGRDDVLALAAALGVRRRAAERVFDGLVEGVDGWLPLLTAPPLDHPTLDEWQQAVLRRRDRLARSA